ncbi:VWA domain-containing protein [Dactylosporangium sp. NPDC005555]|uniref:VWA domain-containing protein n=1 Tax=Dactylosporangium sp. NPDC005555 TaxID=3154889 RepID=UPI0033A8FF27
MNAPDTPAGTRTVLLVIGDSQKQDGVTRTAELWAAAGGLTITETVVSDDDYTSIVPAIAQIHEHVDRQSIDAVLIGNLPIRPQVRQRLRYAVEAWTEHGVAVHLVGIGPLTTIDEQPTLGRHARRFALFADPPTSPVEGSVDRMGAFDFTDRLSQRIVVGDSLGPVSAMRSPLMDGAASPGVPVRRREGPLPHDGLYVRRNNAFGTRSTLGIVDLIDQGVLIDQDQIRFDDFVVANTGRIPAPEPGSAIAVSHGQALVSGGRTAYPATTHLLEIALRAAPTAPVGVAPAEPLPVNFVFAVDTSGSMYGEKLDTVKVAIRELHRQLRDVDVLGIVTFDSVARTALRATRKADLDTDELTRIVGGLRPSGSTDLNLGILYSLDEIARHGDATTVDCVYVFSDGEPTSGETDWIKIRANLASRVRGAVTLSCFGFGSDARMRELDALAGLTGGHSTFVTHADDVRLTLAQDVSRRDHLAAINIQLKIDLDPAVVLWHVYGHDLITDPAARAAVLDDAWAARDRGRRDLGVEALPDLIEDEDGIRIFAPDLAFGETYWIVLEVQTSGTDVGSAVVQYLDTLARDNRREVIDLSAPGALPEQTVLADGIGLWTSEITFYALDDLYEGDRESATQRLSRHAELLRAMYARFPEPQFRDDGVTLTKLVSLTRNLGMIRRWSDDAVTGREGYAIFAMNKFGQSRGGYHSTRA